jgi:MscS family membrane protein
MLRNKIVCFIVFCLSLFQPITAQDFPLDQLSPQSAVYKHLYFLQEYVYYPEKAGEVFQGTSLEKNAELAIKLKQILDSRGIYVDIFLLPRDPNYTDSLSGRNRFVLSPELPAIALEKKGELWYYTNETAAKIPGLYNRTFPLGSGELMHLFPSLRTVKIIGLFAWQWIGIGVLLLFFLILHLLFTKLIEVFTARLIQSPTVPKAQRIATHRMAIPLSWFIQLHAVQLFIPALQLPVQAAHVVMLLFHLLGPLVLAFTLWRVVDLLMYFAARRAEKTETTLDDQLVPLMSKVLKVLVIGFGVVLMLRALNFNIAALIAGVSIGGLAVALAAQDTIKNMFGSLMIFIDKPFQIGDWIQASGVDGTVESVGFRATRVRTFANSLVYVPNGKLADLSVDNFGMRKFRRFRTIIAVEYSTDPEKIDAFVEGMKELVMAHPKTRKDYYEIHLNDFGDSSLNILFYIFFEVPTWSDELRARHEIMLEIIKLAKKLGVVFAFPTQTLHVASFPEK